VKIVKDNELIKTLPIFRDIINGIEHLKGQTLALIGEQSSWLLNSDLPKDYVQDVLGIKLKKLSWDAIFDRYQKVESAKLIDNFSKDVIIVGEDKLIEASKIYTLLQHTIDEYQLSAVSVECFSLVKNLKTTGCLALSFLNQEKIVAGCEGDMANTLSMLVCKEVCGVIPWMANIHDIQDNVLILSHCTIHKPLISKYELTTHFESGLGVSLKGQIDSNVVTIFRIDYENKKIFVTEGDIVNKSSYLSDACRTQVQVKLPEKTLNLLKESPLGNHHLVIPGSFGLKLVLLARFLNFTI
jgi:L-fucose isomerase-like protein